MGTEGRCRVGGLGSYSMPRSRSASDKSSARAILTVVERRGSRWPCSKRLISLAWVPASRASVSIDLHWRRRSRSMFAPRMYLGAVTG